MAKRPKRMATFRLSEATLAAIKAIADEREMSQAEVIEWLVNEYAARCIHACGALQSE
jgi:hypothetical protein